MCDKKLFNAPLIVLGLALLLTSCGGSDTYSLSDMTGADATSQQLLDGAILEFPEEGGDKTLHFTDAQIDSFSLSPNNGQGWLTSVNLEKVEGNVSLLLEAPANHDWDTRKGTLCFIRGKERRLISISQKAFPRTEVSTQVIKLESAENAFSFSVKTNVPVKIVTEEPDSAKWLTYDIAEQEHSDGKAWTLSVKGHVAENGLSGRTATLKVTADGAEPQNVIVWQQGTVGSLNVVLHNLQAGTLAQFLQGNAKIAPFYKSLKVSGKLNGDDIYELRKLLTRYTSLKQLDLEEARIVSGGRDYADYGQGYRTQDDVIGDYMFYSCQSLERITLPRHTEAIGRYAFSKCASMPWIEIPPSVKRIGSHAFHDCAKLEDIDLTAEGSQLSSLGDCVFATGTVLDELYLPASLTDIDKLALSPCRVRYLHVELTTPPDVVITKYFSQAKLYVPKGCKARYAADKNWGKFSDIVEE